MSRKKNQNSNTRALFEEKIKNEVNILIRRDLGDARLVMMTITRVELTQDYSFATCYWDTYDVTKRGDIKKAIDKTAGKVRHILSQVLNVRHTPHVKFVYDSQFEDEKKIGDLLAKTSNSDSDADDE